MGLKDARQRYPFSRQFECLVALAEATVPRFHETIGHALDFERMPHEDSSLVVQAAQAIAVDGTPCPSTAILLQRVRRMVDDGKVTFESLRAAEALLQLADDIGGVGDADALMAELAPIVRKAAQQEAVEASIQDFAKGDVDASLERFNKVAALGRKRVAHGSELLGTREDILGAVVQAQEIPLATGVPELDIALSGGLERGALGLLMADAKVGKSLFLCHLAADAMISGYDVAYVSLELSEQRIKQRIYSNLLDMTPEQMRVAPDDAARRHSLVMANGAGRLFVRYETPRATTPAHLRRWLLELERDRKALPRVLVVDYADRLCATLIEAKQQGSYKEMEIVYDALREIAKERDGWTWTASQVKAGYEGKKRLGTDAASDSKNKVRVADLIVSMPCTEEDKEAKQRRFQITARREGDDGMEVGPLPMDATRGRITMVSRQYPWGEGA